MCSASLRAHTRRSHTKASPITTTPATSPSAVSISVGASVIQDLRRLSAASAAGLVLGFVVNGVGSRLAMMLLARLNPDVTGLLSDDGFRMGQFTIADTLNLVLFATALGVVGGVLFLAVRDLRFGPTWFRMLSMTLGPAVVVGAILVSPDGIDFRVLHPVGLAVALFVFLPGLFAFSMQWLGDRWLDDGSWFLRSDTSKRPWWLLLLPLVVLGPFAVVLVLVVVARPILQRSPALWAVATGSTAKNLVRGALVVAFTAAGVNLVMDVATIT